MYKTLPTNLNWFSSRISEPSTLRPAISTPGGFITAIIFSTTRSLRLPKDAGDLHEVTCTSAELFKTLLEQNLHGFLGAQPNGWWKPENHHPNEKDSHLDPNLGKYTPKKTLGIKMLWLVQVKGNVYIKYTSIYWFPFEDLQRRMIRMFSSI